MPTIPRYTRQVQQDTANLPLLKLPLPQAGEFDNGTAQGLSQIGDVLGGVGQQLEKYAKEKQEINDIELQGRLELDYQDKAFNITNSDKDETYVHNGKKVVRPEGTLNQKGFHVYGATDRTFQKFEGVDDYVLEQAGNIKDKKTRALFLDRYRNYKQRLVQQVGQYEAGETSRYKVESLTNTRDRSLQNAFVAQTPDDLKEAMATASYYQRAINKEAGLDESGAKLATNKIHSDVLDSAINGAISRGLTETQALDMIGEFKQYLPKEEYSKKTQEVKDLIKKRDKEVKEELKLSQEETMKDAVVLQIQGKLNLSQAKDLLIADKIELEDYEKLEKLITAIPKVSPEDDQTTYNEIKDMIYKNTPRKDIQDKINNSIGKTLSHENAEELLDEAFKKEDDFTKSIKDNSLEKIKAYALENIFGEFTDETLTGTAKGVAKNLEYQFNKKIVEENAKGERIYEIADEVIDNHIVGKDPKFKPKERQQKNMKLISEKQTIINPATGEIKQMIGGQWVSIQ